MLRAALLFVLALSTAMPALAGDGWVTAAKARSPEDISLWTRTVPGAELKAFRGATHTDAALANTVAMLSDTSVMCDWIFRCHEARIVGEDSNGDTFVYLKIKGIWPVSDRDAVIRVHPEIDRKTGELLISGTAAPDYLPRASDHVRIPAIESTWRLTPTADKLLRIEWTGHVDPAGNVPRWLANSLATLVPRYTLRHMRAVLDDPAWRSPAAAATGQALLQKMTPRNR